MTTLDENQRAVVAYGEQVWNVNVTSCGLVLGYGPNGVAAYHWPFMSDISEYFQIFQALVNQLDGGITRIEIYTNPIPGGSKLHYETTTRKIRDEFKVPTIHYIYGTSIRGVGVSVTVTRQGGADVSPVVTATFLDLP